MENGEIVFNEAFMCDDKYNKQYQHAKDNLKSSYNSLPSLIADLKSLYQFDEMLGQPLAMVMSTYGVDTNCTVSCYVRYKKDIAVLNFTTEKAINGDIINVRPGALRDVRFKPGNDTETLIKILKADCKSVSINSIAATNNKIAVSLYNPPSNLTSTIADKYDNVESTKIKSLFIIKNK
jgi:hypothetical protein